LNWGQSCRVQVQNNHNASADNQQPPSLNVVAFHYPTHVPTLLPKSQNFASALWVGDPTVARKWPLRHVFSARVFALCSHPESA